MENEPLIDTNDELRKEVFELHEALKHTIIGILDKAPRELKPKTREAIIRTLKRTVREMTF